MEKDKINQHNLQPAKFFISKNDFADILKLNSKEDNMDINNFPVQYEVVDWYEEGEIHERTWYKKKMNVWDNLELHRLEGPAIERANGKDEYWLDGVQYTKESWEDTRNSILRAIKMGVLPCN